jgi:hypothetical protein
LVEKFKYKLNVELQESVNTNCQDAAWKKQLHTRGEGGNTHTGFPGGIMEWGGGERSLEGEGGSAGESSAICLLPSYIRSQNISLFNMFTLNPK